MVLSLYISHLDISCHRQIEELWTWVPNFNTGETFGADFIEGHWHIWSLFTGKFLICFYVNMMILVANLGSRSCMLSPASAMCYVNCQTLSDLLCTTIWYCLIFVFKTWFNTYLIIELQVEFHILVQSALHYIKFG